MIGSEPCNDKPRDEEIPRARSRTAVIIAVVLAGVLLAGAYLLLSGGRRGAPRLTLSFDGETTELAHTQIVPTLDTPVADGKNVVWCATFLAGWKQLQQMVVNGPVQVEGADEVCARLNAAVDPAAYMPPEIYYAIAGLEDQGILQTIEQDMAERFPHHEVPAFDDIIPGSFVTYSYLEARVPFTIPYFDNREPLVFTDGSGKTAPVRSFGLRKEDRDRYGPLRAQGRVLMAEWPESSGRYLGDQPPSSFAVDLCGDSDPCQIVVACLEQGETLEDTLSTLNTKIEVYNQEHMPAGPLGGNDIVLVPDMFWRMNHHFSELEGMTMESPPIQGQVVSVALQDFEFRLDRSGAELSSEAHQRWASESGLGHFICDRPFLLNIKQRGSETPFFVMWVDNAELLQPW